MNTLNNQETIRELSFEKDVIGLLNLMGGLSKGLMDLIQLEKKENKHNSQILIVNSEIIQISEILLMLHKEKIT